MLVREIIQKIICLNELSVNVKSEQNRKEPFKMALFF